MTSLGATKVGTATLSTLFQEMLRWWRGGMKGTARVDSLALWEAHEALKSLSAAPVANPYGSYWFSSMVAKAARTRRPWVHRPGELALQHLHDGIVRRPEGLFGPLPAASVTLMDFDRGDPVSLAKTLGTFLDALTSPQAGVKIYVKVRVTAAVDEKTQGAVKKILQARAHVGGMFLEHLGSTPIVLKRSGDIVYHDNPTFPFPAENVRELVLVDSWEDLPRAEALHDLLRLSRERLGLDINTVIREMIQDKCPAAGDHQRFSWAYLRRAETGGRNSPLPFPVLDWLMRRYRQDIRRAIVASNAHYFPNIPETYWHTRYYPLYIEKERDAQQLRAYHEADRDGHESRGVRSLGRFLKAIRLNSYRFRSLTAMAQELGTTPNLVNQLEENLHRKKSLVEFMRGYSVAAGVSFELIARVFQEGEWPDIPWRQLFGELPIVVQPNSPDLETIQSFVAALVRGQSDGGLGKYLFLVRQMDPLRRSTSQLSRDAGFDSKIWSWREMEADDREDSALTQWIHLLKQTGYLELAQIVLQERGYGEAAIVLGAALGRYGPTWFYEQGILGSPSTVIDAMRGGQITTESILRLKKVLPDFEAARFHRAQHPELRNLFPELFYNRDPGLHIGWGQVRGIVDGPDIRERLFRFRMEAPVRADLRAAYQDLGIRAGEPMQGVQMSSLLGMDNAQYARMEVFEIPSKTYYAAIARVLGSDPRTVYLIMEKILLAVYPLRDPITRRDLKIHDDSYRDVLKRTVRTPPLDIIRQELLGFLSKNDANTEGQPETELTRLTGIPRERTKRFFEKYSRPLPADILDLTTRLETSYQRWYEEFNRAPLGYFLGHDQTGRIKFNLPKGFSRWAQIHEMSTEDIRPVVYRAIRDSSLPKEPRYKLFYAIRQALRAQPKLSDTMIARMTLLTPIDSLLFLWARRDELDLIFRQRKM